MVAKRPWQGSVHQLQQATGRWRSSSGAERARRQESEELYQPSLQVKQTRIRLGVGVLTVSKRRSKIWIYRFKVFYQCCWAAPLLGIALIATLELERFVLYCSWLESWWLYEATHPKCSSCYASGAVHSQLTFKLQQQTPILPFQSISIKPLEMTNIFNVLYVLYMIFSDKL